LKNDKEPPASQGCLKLKTNVKTDEYKMPKEFQSALNEMLEL